MSPFRRHGSGFPFGSAGTGSQRRAEKRRKARRRAADVGPERLEPRAMMAITTFGRLDGSTVVAIDGNTGLTNLYLRGVPTGVELATNSRFAAVPTSDALDWTNPPAPPGNNGNFYTVSSASPLYITNATPNLTTIPLTEANGFTLGSTSQVTDFVLSNGNIYTSAPNTVAGVVRLGADTWNFTNDQFGRLFFTPVGAPTGTAAPVDGTSTISPGNTDRDNRGAGVRAAITIRWTGAVSTHFQTCPQIDVTYQYDPRFDPVSGIFVDAKSGGDFNVGVGAGSDVGFTPPPAVPKNGFGGMTVMVGPTISRVPGTTRRTGTITVYNVVRTGAAGSGRTDLQFRYSDATGTLVFTAVNPDWLQIDPTSTLQNLRFRNAFGVPGTTLDPGEAFVNPGRVTIQGQETWLEYTQEATPSQVTVWPGLDVANAITVETTRNGSSFNVLSPIVSAPSVTALGTSTVNIESPVSVTGGIQLSVCTVPGIGIPPQVQTAVFDAPTAASVYTLNIAGNSLTVSPSGSLAGALPDANGVLTTPATLVMARMTSADLLAYGTIFSTTQMYDLTGAPYTVGRTFTTQPEAGGPDVGLIRGGTVVVNMAHQGASFNAPDALNPDISFHTVSLRTQVDTFRTRAVSPGSDLPVQAMYPYDLSIREVDAITIDAVAGSSRPISLSAGGTIAMGALLTASDIRIEALAGGAVPSRLAVTGPLTTTRGEVNLVADGVTISNSVLVTAADEQEGRDDITIVARAGDVSLNGLVSAVNGVRIQQANPLGPAVSTYANRNTLPLPDVNTVTQTLDVPDDFTFDNLDVEVDITHPFVGDLSGTLIAPDGSRFRLFARVGGGGDNFTGTIFDSEASTPVSAGAAPFTGRFRPLDSLAPLYGRSALGTWRLEIVDSGALDSGSLTNFSIRFQTLVPQVAKVFGPGRVVADTLVLDVQGQVGDSKLLPADTNFYLRTNVDSLTGTIGASASLDELDDVNIASLRAGGFVSLRANGVDPTSGPNAGFAALRANLIDITGLDVAAPSGSLEVFFDTSRKIELGNAQGLRTGRSLNSLAAGDVKIRSSSGSIVALDAPVAGGNARAVRVATTAPLPVPFVSGLDISANYSAGNPGITASTLRGRGNLNTWLGVQVQALRIGDRVLVKNQADAFQNGIYTLTFMSTAAWASNTEWMLIRSADADTSGEFASNTIVSVGERQASGVDQVGTWQITANYVQLNGATKTNASYVPGSSTVTFGAGILNDGLAAGMVVFGPGILPNTTITAVPFDPVDFTPTPTIELSQNPGSAGTSESLKFVSPAATRSGSTTASTSRPDSTLITNLNTAGLEVGMLVVGDGIPEDTVITGFVNATTAVMSNGAGGNADNVSLKFIRPFATRAGTTTVSSTTVTGLTTTGDLREGMLVVGPGIAADTTIVSIVNGTAITLSRQATASQSGVSLKFLAATPTNFGLAPITVSPKAVATDIGSNNPNSTVTFVVSTNGGTNSAAGALGKMIALRQQNAARLGGDPAQAAGSQVMGFQFSSSVANDRAPIRLTQELPEITKAFTIGGSPTYSSGFPAGGKAAPPLIDGSRITHTRSGRTVAAGDLVSGLVVSGSAASGTVIRNVNIGGFSRQQSAAIDVRDAAGVLVSNVKLGESELGIRLGNGVGVRFTGAGTTSGTLLNSNVFGSNDSGLVVDNGASGVSVVGSTFGRSDIFNGVGATLSSGVNQFGVDMITPVRPIPEVQATLVVNSFTLPSAQMQGIVAGMEVSGSGIRLTPGSTRATVASIAANGPVTTVEIAGGTVVANGSVTFGSGRTRFSRSVTQVSNTVTLPATFMPFAWRLVPGLQILSPSVVPTSGSVRATISAVSTNVNTGITSVSVTGGTVTGSGPVTFIPADPVAIPDTLATRVENRFTLPSAVAAGITAGTLVSGPNIRLAAGSARATVAPISVNGVTTFEITGGTVVGDGTVSFGSGVTRFDLSVTKVTNTFTVSSAARSVSALLYGGLGLTGPMIQVNDPATPARIGTVIRNRATGVTTVTIEGGKLAGNGITSFGHVVATTLSGRTITLPATVNMDNLYLGQAVNGTGIAAATVITAIDRVTRTVTFAADRLMTRTGFSVISFGVGGRNTVTQNRTGLVLNGGATTVTNSSIVGNIFNGIDINGSGATVDGQLRDHRIGTTLAPVAGSNQIHSNQGWGIFYTSAVVDDIKNNRVRIQGNFLGTTSLAVVSSTLSNRKGNIGHFTTREEVFRGLSDRLVPRAIDALDSVNNQHGRYQGPSGGGTGGTR